MKKIRRRISLAPIVFGPFQPTLNMLPGPPRTQPERLFPARDARRHKRQDTLGPRRPGTGLNLREGRRGKARAKGRIVDQAADSVRQRRGVVRRNKQRIAAVFQYLCDDA